MTGTRTVTPDEFEAAFDEIIDAYAEKFERDVRKAVKKGGSECRKQLRETTVPGATGEYAEGWVATEEKGFAGGTFVTVHNKGRHASLTHLLENGHEKFVYGHDTGGRVPAYKHIAPAYETGREAMLEALK